MHFWPVRSSRKTCCANSRARSTSPKTSGRSIAAAGSTPPPAADDPSVLVEVLPVAARSRASLTLVLRTERAAAVRRVGRCRHEQEADLADLHTGVQRDREV